MGEGDDGFLRRTVVGGIALAGLLPAIPRAAANAQASGHLSRAGWERDAMRWMQLAFVEDDPGNFDPRFWIDYYARCHADTVVLSAGGLGAFYPTDIPFHHRAPGVAESDAFGVMVAGCREIGMNIVARIEPQGARDDVYQARPEWLFRNAEGEPVRDPNTPDLWATCTLGPYNFEFMTSVVDEIATRYRPEAFFGNRWMPFGICYCDNCRAQFRAASGMNIPTRYDGSDPAISAYENWTRVRLAELVALWTRTMQAVNPQSFLMPNGAGVFPSLPLEYYGRITPAMSIDHQGRAGTVPIWASGRDARHLRSAMDGKPIIHICGVAVSTPDRHKDSVLQTPEIRAWAAGSVAHGARPWIVKFNAKPYDRRWMSGVENLYQGLHRNEAYLRNTANLARIAIVTSAKSRWSSTPMPTSIDDALDHERGWHQALLEARVPFELALDTRLAEGAASGFRVLILPNITHLSDVACRALEQYVRRGGRVVATYETSLYDEQGRRRADFGLAGLFGCSVAGASQTDIKNSYLTLRHPTALARGMEDAPRILGASRRVPVQVHEDVETPITFVPPYPSLPMERLFTTTPETNVPMAVCRTYGRGRVVYMPMDIDRVYWDVMAADHALLLRNAVEWAADEEPQVRIEGGGLVDIAYWRQQRSLTLHLVNLNNPMALRGLIREPIPTGPWTVAMQLPQGAHPRAARALEAERDLAMERQRRWVTVRLSSITEHEIIAIDLA